MNNEKMREEFAAWYLAEIAESYGTGCRAQAEKNLAWVRQDGSFADPMLRLACLAWQASREAIVIELPDYLDTEKLGFPAYDADSVDKAIEAAGLKVKP